MAFIADTLWTTFPAGARPAPPVASLVIYGSARPTTTASRFPCLPAVAGDWCSLGRSGWLSALVALGLWASLVPQVTVYVGLKRRARG